MNITVVKHEGVKCPRCYRYTGEGRFNFDGLCDRCCDVLCEMRHDAAPYIRVSKAWQHELFKRHGESDTMP